MTRLPDDGEAKEHLPLRDRDLGEHVEEEDRVHKVGIRAEDLLKFKNVRPNLNEVVPLQFSPS